MKHKAGHYDWLVFLWEKVQIGRDWMDGALSKNSSGAEITAAVNRIRNQIKLKFPLIKRVFIEPV